MRILKVMKKGISKILKVLLRRLVIVGVVIVPVSYTHLRAHET